MGGLSTPAPHGTLNPKPGVEKSPVQISANRLEVDENVNRAYFTIHLLVVNADGAQYVRSSSGQLTTVVMTLF